MGRIRHLLSAVRRVRVLRGPKVVPVSSRRVSARIDARPRRRSPAVSSGFRRILQFPDAIALCGQHPVDFLAHGMQLPPASAACNHKKIEQGGQFPHVQEDDFGAAVFLGGSGGQQGSIQASGRCSFGFNFKSGAMCFTWKLAEVFFNYISIF